MTTRRSVDLDVPPLPRRSEAPLPANVLDFSAAPRLPLTLGPGADFEIALRQHQRATELHLSGKTVWINYDRSVLT